MGPPDQFAGIFAPDGKAETKSDLAVIETGVDNRKVRMQILLFETDKLLLALNRRIAFRIAGDGAASPATGAR